jgi:transcriptional regulator GlxA family with amidase domain
VVVLAATRAARDDDRVMPRRVAIVALPDNQPLDVCGPAEVLASMNVGRPGSYDLAVVTPGGQPVDTGSGYAIAPAAALEDTPGGLDTLIVAGGHGARHADADAVAHVARLAQDARRVASVCTGAFVLADAGLLDGRRVTTHWAHAEELAQRCPAALIDPEPIFVFDGRIRSSAGVTAGMDLALALVEEDFGARAALTIARHLVLFVKRPGGQAQFSAQLALQSAQREPLRELQAWMVDHLDADLSVAALADRACLSERHFARAFKAETGLTPAHYVERLRVERARLALESTTAPVETVAAQCGFGSVETLRRSFTRRLGVSPAAYRSRFRAAA